MTRLMRETSPHGRLSYSLKLTAAGSAAFSYTLVANGGLTFCLAELATLLFEPEHLRRYCEEE